MDPSLQEMSSQTLESMLVCTKSQQEKKPRPAEEAMKCPRCESTNTKFCYYNNYSLSQPRYFCKSCRRYWTKGGTLRNVPVGGGCRKNKRSSSSSSSKRSQDNPTINTNDPNPLLSYDYSSDMSLAFATLQQKQHHGHGHIGFDDQEFPGMGTNMSNNINQSVNSSPLSGGNGLFDALRSGFFETPNRYQNNFYSGNMSNQHGHWGHLDNGSTAINAGEVFTGGMTYGDTRTGSPNAMSSVKQEGDQSNNRILWGFPWQIKGGDANMGSTEPDYGKQSWNGFGSTWQGLINSPLI